MKTDETMEIGVDEFKRLIAKGEGYSQIKAVCADPILDDASKIQRIRNIIKTHDILMGDFNA